jgi:hypothetical protein
MMIMKTDAYIDQVYSRILSEKPQKVFVISDFCDLMDYGTAKKSLLRLENNNKIQKIMRGVYYNPRYSQLIQEYEKPSVDEVAKAIARNFKWTIAPSGNTALNQLGLSTQVPAKWIYFSDGPYKTYKIGAQELEFKHRTNKEISGMSEKTILIIQALKELGERQITESVIRKLQQQLTDEEKATMLNETKQTTVWIFNVIKKIAQEG